MIKLTSLHYKLKVDSLEIYHKINEMAESSMHEWNKRSEESRLVNGPYVDKPFIEPHEFKHSDYEVKELPLRVSKKDIFYYRTNIDGFVEVCLRDSDIVYVVKESLEYLDKILIES